VFAVEDDLEVVAVEFNAQRVPACEGTFSFTP